LKKIILSLSLLANFSLALEAQTYADNIAKIVFDNCTSCHHNGGIGPFPLMTYTDVVGVASMIQTEVNAGNMPPWSPNNHYSEFAMARSLTATEISDINDWINNGTPQGNPANTPAAPVYNNNAVLGPADLSLRIPTYVSKATSGNDDYVCFSIPTGLLQNETIQALEVIPGNPEIVHHVLAYIDPNGTYGTDTLSHSCGGPTASNIPLIAGYAPGSMPSQFPNINSLKMGVNIPAGSEIVLAMHYPEGSQGLVDSTRINLYFYPQGTSNIRQVSANPLLDNLSFNINANTVDSVEALFPPSFGVPTNYSLFSIFPHAHLLGQNFIVYGINTYPPYDTIPLIHIPKWDFEWQGFYVFKYMQKLPIGYQLYGKCIYDNTTNNPYNPNNPPQNVGFGLNTTDEMFLVYFQYMSYQPGDENYNIDSLLKAQNPTTTTPLAFNESGLFLSSYPNPSNNQTIIHYFADSDQKIQLVIYDLQGKLVRTLIQESGLKGEHTLTWDGRNEKGSKVPAAVYISQLKVGNKRVTNKIVRH
jgi:hypothetical protein